MASEDRQPGESYEHWVARAEAERKAKEQREADAAAAAAKEQADRLARQQRATMAGTLLENYGVGVRAGVITPNAEDEAWFRSMLGLPAMPAEVTADWLGTGGVRHPITLAPAGDGQPAASATTGVGK